MVCTYKKALDVSGNDAIVTPSTTQPESSMTYEEFKAEFNKAFANAAKYEAGQIGYRIAVDRMAELADMHPDYEERMFEEVDA